MQPEAHSEVGYKKPPESGRFRPGQSGNPAGRPRGSKNFRTLIRQVTGEKVTVIENGRRRRLSKTDLMIRQLVNRATEGDLRAIDDVLSLFAKFWRATPESESNLIVKVIPPSGKGHTSEIASTSACNPEVASNNPSERKRSRRLPQAPQKVAVLLRNAVYEKITITENTRRRRVSKLEAMLQHVANRASEGDASAARIMFRLLSELEQREAEAAKLPPTVILHLIDNGRGPKLAGAAGTAS